MTRSRGYLRAREIAELTGLSLGSWVYLGPPLCNTLGAAQGSVGKCTLEKDENLGEQKLVRHIDLDYYVRMERNPNNTTLLRGVGAGDMIVIETPEELLAQGQRLESAAPVIRGT
jgi:hypothetical protein